MKKELVTALLAASFCSCGYAMPREGDDPVVIGQPTIFWHNAEWQTCENGVWAPYGKISSHAGALSKSPVQNGDHSAFRPRPGRLHAQTGTPTGSLGEPNIGIGQTTGALGPPNLAIGQPSGIGQTTIGMGRPNGAMGRTTIGIGRAGGGIGHSSGGLGPPNLGVGQPGGIGKPTIGIGAPNGNMGQTTIGIGQPNGGIGKPVSR